ncbi:hypothetical protein [Thauera humireducens]|nr:hypothetical protein [Thauera humireducens]
MPAQFPSALDQLLTDLGTAIAQSIDPNHGLIDTHTGKPTPPDHYGQTCAALALCSTIHGSTSKRDTALSAWIRTPDSQIDHLPFNRLAMHLLRTLHPAQLDVGLATLIEHGIARCRLRPRYPSNNWTLLAATCRLLEAPPAERPRHARTMACLIQRWTTAKGAFIDYPAKPGANLCTPLAYHHKALFLGALALRFCADDGLAAQTRRLFDWLVHCWDSAGYAGGFGRSTHALFGDGCLIATLLLLDIDESGPIDAIAQRLLKQRRPDGFLWLDPWGPTEGAAHWDDYMHLSVYNAWAAAMIQAARAIRAGYPLAPQMQHLAWNANRPGLFHDEEAGLASWRDEAGNVVLLSTTGQPPQAPASCTADLRYSGGRIYHLRVGSSPAVMTPSYRGPLSQLQSTPDLADPTPLLREGTRLCVIDRYPDPALEATASGFTLRLHGQAHLVAPSPPASLRGRIVAAIDWRFLGGRLGRGANLKRTPLPGHDATRTLQLDASPQGFTVTEELALLPFSHARCVHPASEQFSEPAGAPPGNTAPYVYRRCRRYSLATGTASSAPA